MQHVTFFIKRHKFALLVSIVLAIVPFFWLKPGELELGGDSSRLYLYDPISYLKASSLYAIAPSGMGDLWSNQSMLPFLLVLEVFYFIFHSPYILTIFLYALSLVGAFLFVYLIVVEILKNHVKEDRSFYAQVAGILSGLFYTLSPSVGQPMQVALIIHNQVFLNPIIFYLMLMFLKSHKSKYLWLLLFTTFIFAPNFSLAVPALFSFYPLTILFLILYVALYLKKSLPWKKLLIGIILYLGIHAFHIIPAVVNTFDPGSYYNLRIFNTGSIQNEGFNYFSAILPYGMVIKSFLYTYGNPYMQWATFTGPFIIILGFLMSKKKQKDLILIAIFFFITTFLESANITQVGVAFYRLLFYVPGFSMFRNFYGQWQWVQAFFYSLLLGYAIFLILSKLKKRIVYVLSILIAGSFIVISWPLINGQILRQPHRTTNNVSTIIKIDPNYKKILSFFKNQPDDGKIFDFPFTEFAYQVIPGVNRGAYIGPSPTSFLTGRRDFAGQQILEPFSQEFLKLIDEKKYASIKRLFGLLNIRYIFYISDPRAYEKFFPELPFTLLLKVLPDSKSLNDFVGKVSDIKIFEKGNYLIYNSDSNYYLPRFYVPTSISLYDGKNYPLGENESFFVDSKEIDPRIGYIKNDICTKFPFSFSCKKDNIKMNNIPNIGFERINPTKYKVIISDAKEPFFLIFSNKFLKDWKAFISDQKPENLKVQKSYFDGSILEYFHQNIFLDNKTFETLGMKSLPENQHFIINGYANAWYITPTDSGGKNNYEIIIELGQQSIFYYSLVITLLSFVALLVWGVKLVFGKK